MHSSNSRDSLLSRGEDSFCCRSRPKKDQQTTPPRGDTAAKRTLMRLKTVIGAPYRPSSSSKWRPAAEKKGSTTSSVIGGLPAIWVWSWLQKRGMLPLTWTNEVNRGLGLIRSGSTWCPV